MIGVSNGSPRLASPKLLMGDTWRRFDGEWVIAFRVENECTVNAVALVNKVGLKSLHEEIGKLLKELE